ncbi:hypothetical protein ACU4GD_35385 [Cupriavidus basilensis]
MLLDEAVEALVWRPDGVYVDGTFGRGGRLEAGANIGSGWARPEPWWRFHQRSGSNRRGGHHQGCPLLRLSTPASPRCRTGWQDAAR